LSPNERALWPATYGKAKAAEALGGLHGLVNDSGVHQPSTLMEIDAELFDRHMRIDQLGRFLG
jgi:3alpha(or 20beta)-hydroxysteroid dehydrogenase